MPSLYLQPSDYLVYGLPNTITTPQVTQASKLIDSYLRRPEGLIYGVDYTGAPAYMAGVTPTLTVNSSGAIASGNVVVVPISTPLPAYNDMIGEVLILDRENPELCEACVIQAMTQGQITLVSVANNHGSNCTLDFGLTIFEERETASRRSIIQVGRPPVRLLSGLGRYGYGRRTDQMMGLYNDVNLLAELEAFGGPPQWMPFDITQVDLGYTARTMWIPAGLYLAYYTSVRVRYVSGFSPFALPAEIKQACATLITTLANQPVQGTMQSIKAGSMQMTRFAASVIDNDTRLMLDAHACMTLV